MENRSHALVAGLFTLFLGISCVAALWWFGGSREETDQYVLVTDGNVTGLNVQAQVRYRGILVGKVDSIALDPEDARKTLIGVSLAKNIPITRGTTAKLGYQGVTGIAHVLLEDEGTNTAPLPSAPDAPARIAMRDSLLDELTDMGGDTLRNAREVLSRLNEILRPENRLAISRTLAHVEATTNNARETSERLNQLLTAENVRRMNAALEHAEQSIAQAGPFFAEARGLVARMQSASEKFEAALGEPPAGGVGALVPRLNDLAAELSASSRNLNRVLQMLEDSPQSLIFGRENLLPGPGEAGFVVPSSLRK